MALASSVVATGAWALVLSASGTFEQLLSYVIFVGWIFYALGAAAVVVLSRKRPQASRPYRVPGYPVVPLLFVLSTIYLLVNAIVTPSSRVATLITLGVVAVGIPVYYITVGRAQGGSVK